MKTFEDYLREHSESGRHCFDMTCVVSGGRTMIFLRPVGQAVNDASFEVTRDSAIAPRHAEFTGNGEFIGFALERRKVQRRQNTSCRAYRLGSRRMINRRKDDSNKWME